MRRTAARSVAALIVAALVIAALEAPASAAKRVGAPWVVAASPTSVTLDWSGSGSYRVYSSREGGGSRHAVKASTSKRTVTGLRPETMYCFQVARSNGSGRSKTYCHSTTGRVSSARTTKISVATFNVCAHEDNCGHWSGREKAIVQRILDSHADVVALQEVGGKVTRLAELLAPHGYDLSTFEFRNTRDEAVFHRASKLTVGTHDDPTCHREPDTTLTEEEVPDWDKSRPHYSLPQVFTWNGTVWVGHYTCNQFDDVSVPAGRGAPGIWISLKVNATGKRYTFVSVHLRNGTSDRASQLRKRQMRRTVQWMKTKVPLKDPIIYAGDFNSSRMRDDDTPRKELAKAGYTDAFERSSSYSKSYVNTYNGYDLRPRRGVRYGDHIDRIFVPSGYRVSDWAVVAPLRRGKNVRPMASDHYAVRATLWLP